MSGAGPLLLAVALGYALGSVPFGLVVTRLAGAADPRSVGSGNIGATNVLRSGAKGLAALTLLGDALKGTLAVLLAASLWDERAALAAAAGAFLGHLFPAWLRFRGGKGVATLLGVLLGLWWPAALAFALAWIGVAVAARLSSLAALVASLVAPLALALTERWAAAALVGALTAGLWIMHRGNIARLLAGTEPRIGAKSVEPTPPPPP